ncbi:hypothetical protein J7E73_06715 [Paenibacillus albidus]|uniref:hypothetical protein n=1 Tax=Paenibacillus albidus TaxID=2041023 RepID=UPI001BED34C6|nr:hypothetical protein [Paenibacillus albidus]MBT2288835.1 hypothetical protein [Paenibacillus albidus]
MDSYIDKNKKICDLISSTFALPVFYIDPSGKVIYESSNHQFFNPLYENLDSQKFLSENRNIEK